MESADITEENSPGTRSGSREMVRGLLELFKREAVVAWTRAVVI